MAETTQIESQSVQPQSYNLSLTDLPYDEKYRLNQASASQLVRGLQEMGGRLGEAQNDYQRELYPALKKIVTQVVEQYNNMLQGTNEVEREIRRFNLHGYNGRVKRAISTRGVKFNLVYKYANFGDYLKTVTQRLTYLVERPLPQRYVTNTTEGTAYEQLKVKIQEFLKFLKDEVEQSWNTAVTQARTAGGNSVQENLRRRTERVTTRRTAQQSGEQSQQPQGQREQRNYGQRRQYGQFDQSGQGQSRGFVQGRGQGRRFNSRFQDQSQSRTSPQTSPQGQEQSQGSPARGGFSSGFRGRGRGRGGGVWNTRRSY